MRALSAVFTLFTIISVFVTAAYAENHHPIFAVKEWQEVTTMNYHFTDNDGTKTLWKKVKFYEHRHPEGMYRYAVFTVFGETAVRSYAIYYNNGNRTEVYFSVEKDGSWYTVKNGDLYNEEIRDASGKLVGLVIVLEDENGKEILRREVKRK